MNSTMNMQIGAVYISQQLSTIWAVKKSCAHSYLKVWGKLNIFEVFGRIATLQEVTMCQFYKTSSFDERGEKCLQYHHVSITNIG